MRAHFQPDAKAAWQSDDAQNHNAVNKKGPGNPGLGHPPRYSTAIGLVLFAGAIELAQLFVPGRHARLSDFVVDALAACIGLAASQVVAPKQPIRRRSLTLTWHIYESPACAWR